MPEPGETVPDKAPEPTKMPLIERVCMLLVDPSRKDIEVKHIFHRQSALQDLFLVPGVENVHPHVLLAVVYFTTRCARTPCYCHHRHTLDYITAFSAYDNTLGR